MQIEKVVFDLATPPHTESQLTQWSRQMDSHRATRLRCMRWAGILFLAATGMLLAVLWWATQPLFAMAVAAALLVSNGVPLVLSERRVLAEISAQKKALEPLSPETHPIAHLTITTRAKSDPLLREYFQAVAAQGRPMVRGELAAAETWMSGSGARKLHERAMDAWEYGVGG